MNNIAAIKEPPIIKDPQLFAYLQETARQINFALSQNEVEVKKIVRRTVQEVEEDPGSDYFKARAEEAAKLRGLIEQTAYLTERIGDVDIKEMAEQYVAKSVFGEIFDQTVQTIVETASTATKMYEFFSRIQALDASDSALREFQVKSTQYIKTGKISMGEYGEPKVGIAIGHSKTQISDGSYDMDIGEYSATFTADELAFWRGGSKMAWMDSQKMYISNAQINNDFRIGNWRFHPDAGTGDLTISYQAG